MTSRVTLVRRKHSTFSETDRKYGDVSPSPAKREEKKRKTKKHQIISVVEMKVMYFHFSPTFPHAMMMVLHVHVHMHLTHCYHVQQKPYQVLSTAKKKNARAGGCNFPVISAACSDNSNSPAAACSG